VLNKRVGSSPTAPTIQCGYGGIGRRTGLRGQGETEYRGSSILPTHTIIFDLSIVMQGSCSLTVLA
jgi:hypothetical protein